MKKANKINASDNNTDKSFSILLKKLTDFEIQRNETEQKREELTIWLPDSFMRSDAASELLNREVFFDLVYSKKRLRFAVKIGKKSTIPEFTIESILHNEATSFTSFLINQKLQLTIADIRAFIEVLGEFFQPAMYEVRTINNETFLPKEYTALRAEEVPHIAK